MDDQGKKQIALLCDQSPTYAAGYAAGLEIGREAGMRGAATDARLIDWLEKALFAKSWNAVIDSGSRTHWRIVEGHRHITAKMEGATFRDAILSAIGGGK